MGTERRTRARSPLRSHLEISLTVRRGAMARGSPLPRSVHCRGMGTLPDLSCSQKLRMSRIASMTVLSATRGLAACDAKICNFQKKTYLRPKPNRPIPRTIWMFQWTAPAHVYLTRGNAPLILSTKPLMVRLSWHSRARSLRFVLWRTLQGLAFLGIWMT